MGENAHFLPLFNADDVLLDSVCGFTGGAHAEAFADVCAEHGGVIHTDHYATARHDS